MEGGEAQRRQEERGGLRKHRGVARDDKEAKWSGEGMIQGNKRQERKRMVMDRKMEKKEKQEERGEQKMEQGG